MIDTVRQSVALYLVAQWLFISLLAIKNLSHAIDSPNIKFTCDNVDIFPVLKSTWSQIAMQLTDLLNLFDILDPQFLVAR